jgi:hypothetical protein
MRTFKGLVASLAVEGRESPEDAPPAERSITTPLDPRRLYHTLIRVH